jgi:GNAT superfamily N-acetyltransferase
VSLRELTLADRPAVEALIDRCEDFFVLTTGGPGNFDELWTALPPGRSLEDKRVYGIGEPLAGVADVVRDWPAAGTWIIGLLLLDPAARGHGLGPAVVAELDAMAAAQGARRLRVAVVEQNPRALAFWQREGFTPVPAEGPGGAQALERPANLSAGRARA